MGFSLLVAALAFIASGVGLFWQGGKGPSTVTTIYGQAVRLYGHGLYRHDTLFAGAGNRGTDAVTLFLSIPLLVVSVLLYRRGSLRGSLLLTGMLAYFLYVYASLALGSAYNSLFLLTIAVFSASLFAFMRSIAAIDLRRLPTHFSPRLPHRGIASFMLICGLTTLVVWLGMGLLPALIRGGPPKLLDSYTTSITDVVDLGIITPACFLAGFLLLRRSPLGYVMTVALLGILVMLGPVFAAQTVSQLSAGVSYTPGDIIGPIGGFGFLSLVAAWLLVVVLRNISDTTGDRPSHTESVAAEQRPTQSMEQTRRDAAIPRR
jgi:hypothetical protein